MQKQNNKQWQTNAYKYRKLGTIRTYLKLYVVLNSNTIHHKEMLTSHVILYNRKTTRKAATYFHMLRSRVKLRKTLLIISRKIWSIEIHRSDIFVCWILLEWIYYAQVFAYECEFVCIFVCICNAMRELKVFAFSSSSLTFLFFVSPSLFCSSTHLHTTLLMYTCSNDGLVFNVFLFGLYPF